MAGSNEVALGVASLLASDSAPNPVPLSFRGQAISEAGTIILAILSECRDADILLDRVVMDPQLHREVTHRATILDVPVQSDRGLHGEVLFFR